MPKYDLFIEDGNGLKSKESSGISSSDGLMRVVQVIGIEGDGSETAGLLRQ
ncbi:hypothetical protein AGMMS49593_08390 [Endomicrobiia bacterium]|nr:hypothetical protein AGMMS49593_08390 [Endomicrobiia bacterium]